MSKFDRNRIKDGWEKLCTNKQTNKQTSRHYKNNGHLAVNQKVGTKHDKHERTHTRTCTCNIVDATYWITTTATTHLMALHPRQPGWASNSKTLTPCVCGYYTTSWINFLHSLQSIASSLRIWWVRQSLLITSLRVFFRLPLGLTPSTSQSTHFHPIIVILSKHENHRCTWMIQLYSPGCANVHRT